MTLPKTADSKAAVIIIDMENAFVLPGAPFQIKGAMASVPACKKVLESSRENGIPIFYVKRIYRADGSDVEPGRWEKWNSNGRAMSPGSTGLTGAEYVDEIKPQPGDYTIVKQRWSAFMFTELDLILRRLGIEVVVLIGTTTPNCIRTTAYDGDSLGYEVIVVEDACSSNTPEIQAANIADMKNMGALIMSADEYAASLPNLPRTNIIDRIRGDMAENKVDPEPIASFEDGSVGWKDKW